MKKKQRRFNVNIIILYLVEDGSGVVDHVRDQRQLEQLVHAIHYLESEGVYFGR